MKHSPRNLQAASHPVRCDPPAAYTVRRPAPCTAWLTGLSGAGKSTIAKLCQQRLNANGVLSYVLDGDELRQGINQDLGFSVRDRAESVRRTAHIAKLMSDAGYVVFTALVSPFRVDRDLARALNRPGDFMEIFIDVPLEVAEQRDPKGLYRLARAGKIPDFTGIDSPYEAPVNPELWIRTDQLDAERAADYITERLCSGGNRQ